MSDRCPPSEPLDPPKPGSIYNPGWTPREKVLFLLDEAPTFNQGRSDRHPESWAGFKKALFLMRFPECPTAEWMKKDEKEREAWNEKHKDEFDPPPYEATPYKQPAGLDPLEILQKIQKDYPDDRDADLYFATQGRVLEGRNEYVKARKIYDQFLEKYAKSKWTDDVKASLHDMQHPALSVSSDEVSYPREEDALSLSSRNIKDLEIGIYEIDLPKVLKKNKQLKDPHTDFTDTYGHFKDFKGAKKYLKKKAASLSYTTRDKGDFRWVSGRKKLPELPVGTYLVHVKGAKVESISLFIKTDMIIVGKPVKDSIQYLVTDSFSGKPRAGIDLVIKESYYDYSKGYKYFVRITKAKTDGSGRYTYHLLKGNDISSNRVQALAEQGKRMAVTQGYYGSYYYRGEDDTFKIFTYTDRPVYRPGDTINFKHIVRSYKDGKNGNAPNARVKMEVTNPKGERIFEKEMDTTLFGTVWGEVTVEDEAPLGVYNARAYVVGNEARSYQSSGSQFRVEEYKKPEFEVEVEPSKKLASAGESISALVKATYYWGAPVAGAKVKYHVYRSAFRHVYTPPGKWDWLYGAGYGIAWEQPFSGGEELMSDGEGVTDDLGNMEVTLPRMETDSEYDFEYKVVAEVTDLSRRTISGAGTVKFTRDPFFVHIVTKRSFYTEGDKVEAEILAMTADDEPVPAEGRVEIVKITYPAAEKEKEEIIEEHKVMLDAKGRVFQKTKIKDAGQYKIRFKGKHKGGKEVTGEWIITVVGKDFSKKMFRFGNVDILSQERTYKRGDTIKVLIATPWEDATIWVSLEGGDEVLHDEIRQPKGGSFVMSIKAGEGHQPNFFVRAIVVAENQVHQFERELFIPPEEGVLEAEVSCSRDEFKPREKGKFSITVRDHKGNPVKGEFSLAVFDSSVLYIQSETAGDIRPYYYGDRRYINIYPFHSAQIYFSSFSKDGNKWPDFDTAGLPSASGYFYTPFSPGDMFLCPSCGPQTGAAVFGVLDNSVAMEQTVETKAMEKNSKKKMKGEAVAQTKLPAGAPAKAMRSVSGKGEAAGYKSGEMDNKDTGVDAAEVREYFPDTALWKPDVVTGKDGKAQVEIEWPDSLTTWAVRVVGVDGTNKVGIARTEVKTTKKLVARLETPRFMVEGDRAKLAAVVHNDYAEPLEVTLKIKITGEGIEAVGDTEKTVTVGAGKDKRHDFEVQAIHAETVKIQLSALSSKDKDALLKTFEVLEWGSDKMVNDAGILRKPGKLHLGFDVPKERKTDTTELTVVAEPSIGGSLLRALPYLIHYPYGCVEQTMSRFFPAVMVSRTLKESGVKLSSIPDMARKASLADPLSTVHADVQMAWWEQPVFDDKELDKIVKKGLKRLYDFQHTDGGWAWWKWGDSDPSMTAYVLLGLVEARNAGYTVDGIRIDRGMAYLKKVLKKMNKKYAKGGLEREMRSFIGYVLSMDGKVKYEDLKEIYEHREAMSHYGQALLGLAHWNMGEKDKAELGVENLINVSWTDDKNKTASFKWTTKGWWRWYNNRIETVSWVLRAVMTVKPGSKHGDYFAKWLMLNRQGNRWFSTRDTAFALYGLTLYMSHYKELAPNCTVRIMVDGKEKKKVTFTKENMLAGEGAIMLRGKEIGDGKLDVAFDVQGQCSLYGSAFLTYFTKEPKIEGSGNEIFIERSYFKLVEKKKKVKTWRGVVTKLDYERVPLKDGDEVRSGDLIEVKIMVEAKNDYEYLVFEDFKPAGCEPTELKSGGVFENGTWINRELRDEKVVNFLYNLSQGKQAITYKMRAEIPGKFRVLPHKGYAMYAPRVRAISDSDDMTITD
jgi:uncharacterized protein YfaS (alpha-2-macroglobulin family)